ncbi:MAG: 50S ribosomal protein L9 [Dehalococcoidia bacterium]|nr:50S ribosomal protein L9 [Dehalococcoidia bacterium]
MRVVFLEDVPGVAQGGDVKEVKNGFARNYLIPKSLATPATHNALQRIAKLQRQAQVTRVRQLEDMKELAAELDGSQINVEMRAGSTGRLYGSVTAAIIAARLAELTEKEIDRRTVTLSEPIRDLGEFDLSLDLHPDVQAGVSVLVYPTGTTPEAYVESLRAAEEAAAAAAAEAEALEEDEDYEEEEYPDDEEEEG